VDKQDRMTLSCYPNTPRR